jgi:hypothetical protein
MIKPQRIVHDIKPGAMLKRTGATELPRQPRSTDGDADYLGLIRRLPCLSCGMEPSEAAHVRFASAAFGKASGMQKKPHDSWALPLCSAAHRLAKTAQHARNEREFWESLGILTITLLITSPAFGQAVWTAPPGSMGTTATCSMYGEVWEELGMTCHSDKQFRVKPLSVGITPVTDPPKCPEGYSLIWRTPVGNFGCARDIIDPE